MPFSGTFCLSSALFLWLSTRCRSTLSRRVTDTLSSAHRSDRTVTIRAICTASAGFKAGRGGRCTLYIVRSWYGCLDFPYRSTVVVGALGTGVALVLLSYMTGGIAC
jgi:hypothetical protein